MRYERACFIMTIDSINIFYENDIFIKHEFYYFSIYV